jgi:ribulose kinase
VAFAPLGTRHFIVRNGADFLTGDFFRCSIRSWLTSATGSTTKLTTRQLRPARSARSGRKKLGLPEGIPVAIGEFDVHYGAIGSGVDEGVFVKAIGTSTCDCCVVHADKQIADIPGICGIVKGAILPGYYGIEAGQSAVGDLFKWWVEVVCEGHGQLHAELTREVAGQKPGQSGLLALDWNNGNRTILVDPRLSGLIMGKRSTRLALRFIAR